MTLVHGAFTESILTLDFICWFGSLSVKQKSSLNSIVKVSNKIIWTWAACLTSTKSSFWTNYSPSCLIAPIACIQSYMCCLLVFSLGSHKPEPTSTNTVFDPLLSVCWIKREYINGSVSFSFLFLYVDCALCLCLLLLYCYANNCSLGDNKVATDWLLDSSVNIGMNAIHLAHDP